MKNFSVAELDSVQKNLQAKKREIKIGMATLIETFC